MTDLSTLLNAGWRGAGYYIAEPSIYVREDVLHFFTLTRPCVIVKDCKVKSKSLGNDLVAQWLTFTCEISIAVSGTHATDLKNIQNYYNEINYILTNYTGSAFDHVEIGDGFDVIPSNRRFIGAEFTINALKLRDYSS